VTEGGDMIQDVIPLESIERRILMLRGLRVMLDADLAVIYGISTKRLNEQVRRNIDRFPSEFIFQLTKDEKKEVVANCDHLTKLKYSRTLPNAFTEHGAVMLATVLNTPIAVQTSIQIVKAFIKLREMLASNAALARKIRAMEKKYDQQFKVVFEAIYKLMEPPQKERRKIGFKRENEK
jgi:hypothetical protein